MSAQVVRAASGRKAPATPAAFRRQAEAGFRRANPEAGVTITGWTFGPERVTWADGSTGFSGLFTVEAPGYRPREVHASTGSWGLMVR